ncbi:MAG: hypothetical protein ABI561_06995 [Bradyrhizobium sp.]
MRSVLFVLALVLIGGNAANVLIGGSAANAACSCLCVDGRMQPLCEGIIDPPKICPPTVCPVQKPSVAPVIPPNLLTLGGSQCKQAQVCDTSGKCAWEQVCR